MKTKNLFVAAVGMVAGSWALGCGEANEPTAPFELVDIDPLESWSCPPCSGPVSEDDLEEIAQILDYADPTMGSECEEAITYLEEMVSRHQAFLDSVPGFNDPVFEYSTDGYPENAEWLPSDPGGPTAWLGECAFSANGCETAYGTMWADELALHMAMHRPTVNWGMSDSHVEQDADYCLAGGQL